MTAYIKTTWVDEVLAGAERFNINDNAGAEIYGNVEIELNTAVTTAGTSLNAANMNKIEDAIEAISADGAIKALNLDTDAVETSKIKDAAVTADKIANRTRTIFLPAIGSITSYYSQGVGLDDGVSRTAQCYWCVPKDFVSDLKITPIVIPAASGDIEYNYAYRLGAVGEAYNTHDYSDTSVVKAITIDVLNALLEVALVAAAIDDIVHVKLTRNGGNAPDTIGNIVYCPGWLISYTADS